MADTASNAAAGNSEKEKAIKDFKNKVKCSVFLYDLAPTVSKAVVLTALGQFGNVVDVEIIKNYLDPKQAPVRALVEMETPAQARSVLNQMKDFLFMMGGMPRPVKAIPATEALLSDCPLPKKRLKLEPRILKKTDPGGALAFEWRDLAQRHLAEVELLTKCQKEAEEKLATEQEEQLSVYYKALKRVYDAYDSGAVQKMRDSYSRAKQ
ncbi:hypothetical protein O6H91_11G089800 [Diphasiastrum complanatum]|uniref:Uncharacterized protein n=2 Tax=Diphasiastrum complanatum TaxID=34168 RepID=A0ACC2CBR1_DIPCM|nr:hypothetical protein O6H91_11G069100 [Diphasiastrum complanatum]KAJ7539377.1 hypothetical protein O6H91_11G089800 [Diphasiastrum complanatum]